MFCAELQLLHVYIKMSLTDIQSALDVSESIETTHGIYEDGSLLLEKIRSLEPGYRKDSGSLAILD
jgi:hypothetical protein